MIFMLKTLQLTWYKNIMICFAKTLKATTRALSE